MGEISSVPHTSSFGFVKPFPATGYAPVQLTDSALAETDRLDISEAGHEFSRFSAILPFRASKVASVRQAILDGAYETPDKLEVAIDSLLREIGS